MILSEKPSDVEIPHEAGNFIELADLGWLHKKEAENAAADKSIQRLELISQPVLDKLLAMPRPEGAVPATQLLDDEYLLINSIKGWKGPLYDYVPCTVDNIRLLDSITAAWLLRLVKANLATK